jgi:hypothetical protein
LILPLIVFEHYIAGRGELKAADRQSYPRGLAAGKGEQATGEQAKILSSC